MAHVSFSPSGAVGDLETVDAVMKSLREARVGGELKFPDGNFELQAVGSFQNQIEANLRLMWIVPTVILINLFLHYLHFRNFSLALVVFSGIPVAAAGGMIQPYAGDWKQPAEGLVVYNYYDGYNYLQTGLERNALAIRSPRSKSQSGKIKLRSVAFRKGSMVAKRRLRADVDWTCVTSLRFVDLCDKESQTEVPVLFPHKKDSLSIG